MSTDHTSDPMADRWEALTQAIRAKRDAHRKLRAERDAHPAHHHTREGKYR